MSTTQQNIDASVIIKPAHTEREKALRVRNALLELVRSWEDMNDLPRAIPTLRERGEKENSTVVRREAREAEI